MDLTAQDCGDALLICVPDTRIDASVAIQFKDKMREITNSAHARIVLDLSRVDFVDSSGLGAVVGAMKQLGSERRLDLAGLTPNVAKVFRLTRMDRVFRIFDDADSATQADAA
ncbi:STAS domain-containing protein [Actibacterium sp. XHP0104]|uniref:STAS domain-containing protein n=1 Tax=Actibacterium sp. XHP0104 TaxID=2984335 RepID=UPI0021E7534B|nr:STAS domain-containing protein [Actibacterium sp. XHP0104]MCV2881946.1 STAS domain-containing protein [Actibacterium sp. XHP0104]